LFVRFWLTTTPPLPAEAQGAAQLKGRQRYRNHHIHYLVHEQTDVNGWFEIESSLTSLGNLDSARSSLFRPLLGCRTIVS
jgi:hypothetical protein